RGDSDSGVVIILKRVHESAAYMLFVGKLLETFQSAHPNTSIVVINECADQGFFDAFIGWFLRQNLDCLQSRTGAISIAERIEEKLPNGIIFHPSMEPQWLRDFASQFDLTCRGIRI